MFKKINILFIGLVLNTSIFAGGSFESWKKEMEWEFKCDRSSPSKQREEVFDVLFNSKVKSAMSSYFIEHPTVVKEDGFADKIKYMKEILAKVKKNRTRTKMPLLSEFETKLDYIKLCQCIHTDLLKKVNSESKYQSLMEKVQPPSRHTYAKKIDRLKEKTYLDCYFQVI